MKKLTLLFILLAFTFFLQANSQIEAEINNTYLGEEQIVPYDKSNLEMQSFPEEIYFEEERGLDLTDEENNHSEESPPY